MLKKTLAYVQHDAEQDKKTGRKLKAACG